MTYLEETILNFIKKKATNGNLNFRQIPADRNTLRGVIGSLIKKGLILYNAKNGLITLPAEKMTNP